MDVPVLELRGVVKEYPDTPKPVRVLSGIDLTVNAGESLAIVGPSGSGKSTLLNLIGVLDTPTSGTVLFKGQDVALLDENELARFHNRETGFVFQQHHLLPQCSVLENVLLPTLPHKESGDAYERAVRLLERVGLSDRLNQLPGRLSGGERQRAAVVRALINRPSLLLADEPTGSLNQEGAEHLAQLLIELNREEKMTLIVVTHSASVAGLMDRVFELQDSVLHQEQERHHG